MGNLSSHEQDEGSLFLSDPGRFSVSHLHIHNSQGKTLYIIQVDGSRVSVSRAPGDVNPPAFILDPDISQNTTAVPLFLLRLASEDELHFSFTLRLSQHASSAPRDASLTGPQAAHPNTGISGLTYMFGHDRKELDHLINREFHANPNLHKNSNVELLGDYNTAGQLDSPIQWTWVWKPPRLHEMPPSGWRTTSRFVEYDQRAHKLHTLAQFSFWVQDVPRVQSSLPSPVLGSAVLQVPRTRLVSNQSIESRLSRIDSRGESEGIDPIDSPPLQLPTTSVCPVKVDVTYPRPDGDMSAVEDGPLFRATMKALESKTGSMRSRMKKVIKKAEAAHAAQLTSNSAIADFMEALHEAANSNANAIQPALEHYFEKIAKEILLYEQINASGLQKLIIEPLSRVYQWDIKQAESKKKDFEEESKEYYNYVGKYLGKRNDTLKEKKLAERDEKYQFKRRTFELKRFDYSSFMQDLHGGRKEQEVLSQLTQFADSQTQAFLATASRVRDMQPQLEALSREVKGADKDFQFQRREREEKRRALEQPPKAGLDTMPIARSTDVTPLAQPPAFIQDGDLAAMNQTSPQASHLLPTANGSTVSNPGPGPNNRPLSSTESSAIGVALGSPEMDIHSFASTTPRPRPQSAQTSKPLEMRKEGLLWALSRAGSHVDPKGLSKLVWHKYWIVLALGKLSEYSNWKSRIDLHGEPIDLRVASVREARNADRRFCFEVITPHFTRVYQATSDEDMKSWIRAINEALQNTIEGGNDKLFDASAITDGGPSRNIGSMFSSKSTHHTSFHRHHHDSAHQSIGSQISLSSVARRTTTGNRPAYFRQGSNSGFKETPEKLLKLIREADQGNCWCADCDSKDKVEWVSINLSIIVCIQCSGIHRSLGTHITKIRSLTLDTISFTADLVELLLLVGNRVSNMIWEARLDRNQKPGPSASRDQRLRFITSKYVDRNHIDPLSAATSPFPSSADETLLSAIKKNDIQAAIYGLAVKGNPNVTDRSRGTHAVFLALAAADPATPSSFERGVSPPASGSTAGTTMSTPQIVKPFPLAELLLQNGAEIPHSAPPILLSPNASACSWSRSCRGRR